MEKNLFTKALFAMGAVALMASCAKSTDVFDQSAVDAQKKADAQAEVEQLKLTYAENFVKKYGEVDPNQSWDLTSKALTAAAGTRGSVEPYTMEMAQEALGLYINHLLEEKLEIPEPSDIRKVHGNASDIISYVCVDDVKYRRDTRAIKKTLSIPAWLAAEAEERNLSLSRVLQEALMLKIGT